MTTSPPIESKQFRSSVPNLFIFILVMSFVMSLPVAFCTAVAIGSQAPPETGAPLTPGRILITLAFVGPIYPILSLIGACLLSRFCPTTISADGVTTQSFTGGRRFVRWQDITTAKTLRVLNLQWILVYAVNESNGRQESHPSAPSRFGCKNEREYCYARKDSDKLLQCHNRRPLQCRNPTDRASVRQHRRINQQP